METQNIDRSSSPHADAPSDAQYAQFSVGDTQTMK